MDGTDGGTDPGALSILGDSADGNVAAARDDGLPLAIAIISPFADLAFCGASMDARKDMDPYVSRELLESMATDYLGEADPADPRCSVVFADLNALPPLLIQV
jgi:acetyl esterase/lipase